MKEGLRVAVPVSAADESVMSVALMGIAQFSWREPLVSRRRQRLSV